MSDRDVDSLSADAGETGRAARRPYVPPAVRWEEAFDAQANLASACGTKAQDLDCDGTTVS